MNSPWHDAKTDPPDNARTVYVRVVVGAQDWPKYTIACYYRENARGGKQYVVAGGVMYRAWQPLHGRTYEARHFNEVTHWREMPTMEEDADGQ